MNFFNEYALLFAVAVPVLAVVGLNVFLWLGGERGTLLLPTGQERDSSRGAIAMAASAAIATIDRTPVPTGTAAGAPANDPLVREAA